MPTIQIIVTEEFRCDIKLNCTIPHDSQQVAVVESFNGGEHYNKDVNLTIVFPFHHGTAQRLPIFKHFD